MLVPDIALEFKVNNAPCAAAFAVLLTDAATILQVLPTGT